MNENNWKERFDEKEKQLIKSAIKEEMEDLLSPYMDIYNG